MTIRAGTSQLPGGIRGAAIAALALALVLVLVHASTASAQSGACRDDTVHLRGDWGQARFSVEVVDTEATRARGLMFRERMARGAGMLFVYDHPQPVAFWMRNTLIPLDMIFVEQDGRVVRVHHDAVPLDETPIWGGNRIQFVLEINGGIARQIGIVEGSEMRHPRLPQDRALWPCPEPAGPDDGAVGDTTGGAPNRP